MASVERTAYPRFKTSVSARELLDTFTPSSDEITWAAEATRQDDSQLALLVLLKSLQRLGYFPKLSEVPADVIKQVARGLTAGAVVGPLPARTIERYRVLVRSYVGVVHDPAAVRKLIADTIAVDGSDSYANFFDQLLTPTEIEPLIAEYCDEVGLPDTPAGFRRQIETQLEDTPAIVDSGYPNNADLIIDETGHPTLRRRKSQRSTSSGASTSQGDRRTH